MKNPHILVQPLTTLLACNQMGSPAQLSPRQPGLRTARGQIVCFCAFWATECLLTCAFELDVCCFRRFQGWRVCVCSHRYKNRWWWRGWSSAVTFRVKKQQQRSLTSDSQVKRSAVQRAFFNSKRESGKQELRSIFFFNAQTGKKSINCA